MKKIMDSKLGKALRRLVGEETGAVMMEYVILAVLIAAAAVIAIAYFGKTVTSEANVAATAMTGKGNASASQQQEVQKNQTDWQKEAVETNQKFSDAQKSAVGASESTTGGGSGEGTGTGGGN